MLKKEQLSSSNQILIPSRKFLLLFNDTTVHKCHMVKRSSTIHKLDNAAALCRAHLHTIRGNRVYCLIDRPSSKETKSWACYTGRERRGKLLCAAVRNCSRTRTATTTTTTGSCRCHDQTGLPAKAPRFDSSQRPRSFLTFARRSTTDPQVLPPLPVPFVCVTQPTQYK